MRKIILTFFAIIILNSCSTIGTSELGTYDKFDKSVWLAHPDITDYKNPRARMTDDLFKNYLRAGMHRDSILILLGKPYQEGIVTRPPEGLEVPDSLSLVDPANFKEENQDKALKNYNEWIQAHAQPDTLMRYPVGWSTIDPNYLIIKFRSDSTVSKFWIEQG